MRSWRIRIVITEAVLVLGVSFQLSGQKAAARSVERPAPLPGSQSRILRALARCFAGTAQRIRGRGEIAASNTLDAALFPRLELANPASWMQRINECDLHFALLPAAHLRRLRELRVARSSRKRFRSFGRRRF